MHMKCYEELQKTKDEIIDEMEKLQDQDWEYEVRLQKFKYLQEERNNIFNKFNDTIYEVHQKTGLKVA